MQMVNDIKTFFIWKTNFVEKVFLSSTTLGNLTEEMLFNCKSKKGVSGFPLLNYKKKETSLNLKSLSLNCKTFLKFYSDIYVSWCQ